VHVVEAAEVALLSAEQRLRLCEGISYAYGEEVRRNYIVSLELVLELLRVPLDVQQE
jgi:hypothetical protein